jgi:hypothetical protein
VSPTMADLLLAVVTLAFFALAILLVGSLDRL